MVWEWRLLRCFEDFREIFQAKGWETGPRYGDMPSLVAWTGDYCVLFSSWDDITGECWFEVCDRDRRRSALVNEIPTPRQTAELLPVRHLMAR